MGTKNKEAVNHPDHYGGDTTYETIKVIEAWGLNFNLGNAVKYISRAGKKGDVVEDLKKAAWYLNREVSLLGSHVVDHTDDDIFNKEFAVVFNYEEEPREHCTFTWEDQRCVLDAGHEGGHLADGFSTYINPMFMVVQITDRGAVCFKYSYAQTREFLDNAYQDDDAWRKAWNKFISVGWKPGNAMQFPRGFIFCVNKEVEL